MLNSTPNTSIVIARVCEEVEEEVDVKAFEFVAELFFEECFVESFVDVVDRLASTPCWLLCSCFCVWCCNADNRASGWVYLQPN